MSSANRLSFFFFQLENYIQDSMKQDMVQLQQTAVHNHTTTMIEIGTNLLSQTVEQTRKLSNVKAQVRQQKKEQRKLKLSKQFAPVYTVYERNTLQHNTIMKIRCLACEHTGELAALHCVK